jgi:hypothetical protein
MGPYNMESVVVRTATNKSFITHKYILECLLYVMILWFPSRFKSVFLINSFKLNRLKRDCKDVYYIYCVALLQGAY